MSLSDIKEIALIKSLQGVSHSQSDNTQLIIFCLMLVFAYYLFEKKYKYDNINAGIDSTPVDIRSNSIIKPIQSNGFSIGWVNSSRMRFLH